MKPRLRETRAHLDPEFETFTYGDPTRTKRQQLSAMKQGDLIVFYAGLQPLPSLDKDRLHVIGLFDVEHVFHFNGVSASEFPRLRRRIGRNAHFLRNSPETELVVVKGRQATSRLLDIAVPLGDACQHMLPDLNGRIGYEGSLLRAVGHWVDGDTQLGNLSQWIEDGPASLVDLRTRVYTYVLASDVGFAPNPFAGYCTVACCKPVIRRTARVGDWIVDLQSVLSRSPIRRNGDFVQLKNPCHDRSAICHDTKTNRVLISSVFWYFGGTPASLPSRIADAIGHQGRGHRKVTDTNNIRMFVRWLSSSFRLGVHALPRTTVRRQLTVCA